MKRSKVISYIRQHIAGRKPVTPEFSATMDHLSREVKAGTIRATTAFNDLIGLLVDNNPDGYPILLDYLLNRSRKMDPSDSVQVDEFNELMLAIKNHTVDDPNSKYPTAKDQETKAKIAPVDVCPQTPIQNSQEAAE